MRLPIVALFVLAGCSSPERAADAVPAPALGGTPAAPAAEAASEPPRAIDTPTDAGTEHSAEVLRPLLRELLSQACPIPASTCPFRCMAITGRRFDETNQCLLPVVVGCWPQHGQMNSDLGCRERSDGVILEGSSSVLGKLGPDWTGCRPGETARRFPDAPACTEGSR